MFFTCDIKQDVTNRYFQYSIKIDSNRSKSTIIYGLISKIDGNRSVSIGRVFVIIEFIDFSN